MSRDARLSRMTHVIVHMALLGGRETSERIAQMLGTNPVVVRRTMAELKRCGIVDSEGGRGGGWVLLRQLDDLTLLDIHDALNKGRALEAGVATDHPTCPVERATNDVLTQAFEVAEKQLLEEFGRVKLSEIAKRAIGRASKRTEPGRCRKR